MSLIDAHCHIGRDASNTKKGIAPTQQTPSELLKKMDKMGVGQAVVAPFPSPRAEFDSKSYFWYDDENDYILEAAANSSKLIPFLAVNPNDVKSLNNLRALTKRHPVKGVKLLHIDKMGFGMNQLPDHEVMDIIHERGLVLMMHIGTGNEAGADEFPATLDHGIKAAEKYPSIEFVFSHLGRLHERYRDALELDNVHMDTSGLSLDRRFFVARDAAKDLADSEPTKIIEILVDLGFADRLLWGSDEPYADAKLEMSFIQNAGIYQAAKDAILYKNSARLLGLG